MRIPCISGCGNTWYIGCMSKHSPHQKVCNCDPQMRLHICTYIDTHSDIIRYPNYQLGQEATRNSSVYVCVCVCFAYFYSKICVFVKHICIGWNFELLINVFLSVLYSDLWHLIPYSHYYALCWEGCFKINVFVLYLLEGMLEFNWLWLWFPHKSLLPFSTTIQSHCVVFFVHRRIQLAVRVVFYRYNIYEFITRCCGHLIFVYIKNKMFLFL